MPEYLEIDVFHFFFQDFSFRTCNLVFSLNSGSFCIKKSVGLVSEAY